MRTVAVVGMRRQKMLRGDSGFRTITFFDCFAGVGGFRIAFEREGMRCVGWCEIDRFC